MLDFDTTQMLPESQTPTAKGKRSMLQFDDDDDLGLDLGLEPDEQAAYDEPSIEIGRRAATPRRDEPTMLDDDDLGLDLGFGDTTIGRESSVPKAHPFDDDVPVLGMED
jgi:cohesin complex subunit SCC1